MDRAANRYDVIGYWRRSQRTSNGPLAKRGRQVVVGAAGQSSAALRSRGAAFGPDYRITCVVVSPSCRPPYGARPAPPRLQKSSAARLLRLPDGRCLQLPERPGAAISRLPVLAQRCRRDGALGCLARSWRRSARCTCIPPRLGHKSVTSLWDQAAWAFVAAAVAQRAAAGRCRPPLFTAMSIADLLEDWFRSPRCARALAVSGIIGTWAGPRSPGTAYVMAHHKIGGDVGDGQLGSWGLPRRHGRRHHGWWRRRYHS